MFVIQKMSHDLLLDEKVIKSICAREQANYRRIKLPKGRIVWQPCAQLKSLQYWVADFLLENGVDPLPCATAYEVGSSIANNAKVHKKNNHVLRMDIRHFFPSITRDSISKYLSTVKCQVPLEKDDIDFICAVVCKQGSLVMGSPSSPMLANRIMIPVDQKIQDSLSEYGQPFCYTRYSDDLFISSKHFIDTEIADQIESILMGYGFRINRSKTKFLGKGSNRMMAGIAINQNKELSLGQKRKAQLRKALYDFCITQKPSQEQAYSLQGLIAFSRSIKPKYVSKMLVKYSSYCDEPILKKMKRCIKCP